MDIGHDCPEELPGIIPQPMLGPKRFRLRITEMNQRIHNNPGSERFSASGKFR
jgi:hypothetical protein